MASVVPRDGLRRRGQPRRLLRKGGNSKEGKEGRPEDGSSRRTSIRGEEEKNPTGRRGSGIHSPGEPGTRRKSLTNSSRKGSKERPPESGEAGGDSNCKLEEFVSDCEGSGVSGCSSAVSGAFSEAEQDFEQEVQPGRSADAKAKPVEAQRKDRPSAGDQEETPVSQSEKNDTAVSRIEDSDDGAHVHHHIEAELGRFQQFIAQKGLTVQTEKAAITMDGGQIQRESVGVFIARAGYAEEKDPQSPVTPVPKAIPRTRMPWRAGHLRQCAG